MVSLKPGNKTKNEPEDDDKSEQATIRYLMQTMADLQRENEVLKRSLSRSKRTPAGKIGFVMLAIGTLALAGSIIISSTVLAFIGLGLTFWGALFLFARPIKFVRSTLLDSTAVSSYATIDRMIQDLGYKGRPIYIPPFPKEAYLPEYLKGLKEMIVFIPAEDVVAMPTVEEMAKKQFLLENPKGICIAPPGHGLISLIEQELKTEFAQIDLDRLYSNVPAIIMSNLELANEFEINSEDGSVHIRMVGSAYKDLYSNELGLKSIHSVGCPIASAIACAIAKTSAKLVTISKDSVSADLKVIEVWFRILEA